MIVFVFFTSILLYSAGQREIKEEKVTVKVAMEEGRMADVARNAVARFEAANPDITVEVIGIPYGSYNDQIQTALASGAYVYDAFAFTPSSGAGHVKSGWLHPLDAWWDENDPYFTDLLMVDYFSKFAGAPANLSGTYYALPFNTDVTMSIYRKDLYEKHGLTPPETFDEFIEILEILHDPRNELYGWGFPGKGGQFESHIATYIWSIGGQIVDSNLYPVINTEKNAEGLKILKETATRFSAPGMYETDYAEQNELFASGKVAHIFNWIPAAVGTVTNPDVSIVHDKVGYAPIPGEGTRAAGWSIGVASQSRNPDAAFKFIKFLMSPEICRESVRKYTNSLVRISLVEDESLVEEFPWIPASVEALKQGYDYPKVPEGLTIRRLIGEEAAKYFNNQISVYEALQNMERRIETVLRDGGHY